MSTAFEESIKKKESRKRMAHYTLYVRIRTHCVLGARPMRRGELRNDAKKEKKDSKLFVKVVAPIKKYYVIVKKRRC